LLNKKQIMSEKELEELLKKEICPVHGTKAAVRINADGIFIENTCCKQFEKQLQEVVTRYDIAEFNTGMKFI
jgi:hypothetical protein